ncbi:MAG: TIR domain-containing protein, partial [Verrucomicrobia bacterium]|nr:TIR domain-containing protein [Verrucomicrobiota bacterium]
MPVEPSKPPRVFISYSWSSQEHQTCILEWAERLVHDGVDVILDKWHLKEGQDKYAFMEQMVTDPEVAKVLIFSDKAYAEKADARKGGVGTESQIISKEIYERVTQEKFLPVVCELDAEGKPYLPVFLKSRIYFDFSSPETSHENYEKLVRAIFNRPLHKRPPIGKMPEYILNGDKPHRWSKALLQSFKDAVLQDRSTYKGHAASFLDSFADRLDEFRIAPKDGMEFDDQVVASIETFLPFRDDFIEFLRTVILYKNEQELYEDVAGFFERCIRYKFRPEELKTWNDMWFDNFQFILYELFLYVVAMLVRNRRLKEVLLFTDRLYCLPDNAGSRGNALVPFTVFRGYCGSLNEIRNQRLKLNRLSVEADLIKQRTTIKGVTFDDLMQAECVLFLKSLLNENVSRPW